MTVGSLIIIYVLVFAVFLALHKIRDLEQQKERFTEFHNERVTYYQHEIEKLKAIKFGNEL